MEENSQEYDPTWLVELAQKVMPEKTWLKEALKQCKKVHSSTKAYIYFVDPSNANKPNSEWQFKENIIFDTSKEGELVLDILKNGKVGGIEFIDKI